MRKLIREERGMTLIEIVVAVALFSLVVSALLLSLSTGVLGTHSVDQRTIATNLARSQLEYIKSQPYVEPISYGLVSPIPSGYTVKVEGTVVNSGLLQHITVTVSYDDKSVVVSGYKLNRDALLPSVPPSSPAPPAVTELAADDFESGDWSGGTGWLDDWWHQGDARITKSGKPYGGKYHLRLRRSTGYVKRAVNLAGKSGVRLQFQAKVKSFEGSDFAQALVSSNGVDWTVVRKWTTADSDGKYHPVEIDLSAYNLTAEFWIAFEAQMSGRRDYFYVDDLKVIQP
jgi:prepilin-type N-terminal cleavage/methylation domain-containing protein